MYSSGYRPTVGYGQAGDIENAKLVAKRIFDTYDKDRNNIIDLYEVAPMMQDAYRSMNRSFQPSKLDVDSYSRILDRNSDGKITLQDIEALCMRYLVGEYSQGAGGIGGGLKTSQTLKTSGYTAPETRVQGGMETLKSSYPGEKEKMSGYQGESSGFEGRPVVRGRGAEKEKSSGFGEGPSPTGGYTGGYGGSYGTAPERKYPPIVQSQLDQARRIFRKYDTDHSGFLERPEIPLVLADTYRAIGVEKTFTQEEVDSYIRMIDTNKDGKISLDEYEAIVIQTLQKAGIKF